MGIKLINESTLTSIADAIRAKNNTSAPISVEAFPSAISSIQTGIDVDKVMQTGFSGGDIPQDILSGSYSYIRSGALWGQGVSIDIGAAVSTSGFLRYRFGSEAFAGAMITNTASFPINESLIGIGAFKNCNFQSGTFSFYSGGGSIKEELFKNSKLPYFKVSQGTSYFYGSIGQETFANCKSMSYFYIDTGNSNNTFYLSDIGERAFANCSNLDSFSIVGKITSSFNSIGDEAFIDCSNLTNFQTDFKNIKAIGEKAFYNCRQLSNFSIVTNGTNICPTSYIGSSAFAGCSLFVVPQYWISQPTSIYNNAFESCKLTGLINFPYYPSKFYGDEIYKNTTMSNVNFYGFMGVSSTNCFRYGCKGANLSFSQYGQIHFHYFPEGFFENAIIDGPNVLNGITFSNHYPNLAGFEKKAFYNASFIQSSTILSLGQGEQTIFINDEAFYNCKNLAAISAATYGWPISYYGKRAFYNCSDLQTINMGMFSSTSKNDCLCVIDNEAFKDCTALTYVFFTTLNYIGESAFSNCFNLSNFYIYGNQVPILGNQSNYIYTLPAGERVTFYVPSSMVNSYLSAPGWSNYFSLTGKSIVGI